MGIEKLRTKEGRLEIIDDINSRENLDRKYESFKQCEVFEDRIRQYLVEKLEDFFDKETAKEIPKVTSMNITKKVIDSVSALYRRPAERSFNGLDDDQLEKIKLLYKDMKFDAVIQKCVGYFKLQGQNLLYIVPKKGKLKARSLKQHYYDVIEDHEDSEEAAAYLLSTLDKRFIKSNRNESKPKEDNVNASNPVRMNHPPQSESNVSEKGNDIKDLKKYIVWTPESNFIMDEDGDIISEGETESALSDLMIMPFIDIFHPASKDGSYFVIPGESLVSFSVEYCYMWSLFLYTMLMQNFSQPIFSGPPESKPESMKIGPNRALFLPKDERSGQSLEFEFATPSPDLANSKEGMNTMLSIFLSIKNVDTKEIAGTLNGTVAYSSAAERFIAMMQKYEASEEDMATFKDVEQQAFKLTCQWVNIAKETDGLLDAKYLPKRSIDVDRASVDVKYQEPKNVMSKKELLDYVVSSMKENLDDEISAYAKINGIESIEDAERMYMEMIGRKTRISKLKGEDGNGEEP